MAGRENPLFTYGDTVTFQIATSDVIALLSPTEVPFVQRIGLDGDPGKFRVENWPSTQVKWFEDEVRALTVGLGAAITTTTGTSVTLATGAGWNVMVNDVVKVDDEYMYVTARNADTLTVTRGFWGSTAATHASSASVTRVTQAALEGATFETSGTSVPTAQYNYTQIFRDVIRISNSELVQSRYGIEDVLAYQTSVKTADIMRLVEKAAFTGIRSAGSESTPRTMGGLTYFITTNTASMSNNYITETAILNMVRTIYESSGQTPSLLVCGPLTAQTIDTLWEGKVVVQPSSDAVGMLTRRIVTRYGDLEVLSSHLCPPDKAFILNLDHVGFLTYRPLEVTQLAQTGDVKAWQIALEVTMVVRNDKCHGIITGIKTT